MLIWVKGDLSSFSATDDDSDHQYLMSDHPFVVSKPSASLVRLFELMLFSKSRCSCWILRQMHLDIFVLSTPKYLAESFDMCIADTPLLSKAGEYRLDTDATRCVCSLSTSI